jgi:uncharacterized protein YraI
MYRLAKRFLAQLSMGAAALVLAVGGFSSAAPAQAQNAVWSAQYYNNADLNGTPALQRTDNAIAFNWGQGSPASGINADAFSVRWATDIFLQAGTYRFFALADDNIRVTFNFGLTPVIDTFANPSVGVTVQGDVQVPAAGSYHIQVDYREVTDNAYAYVSFANLATNPTGPNFPIVQPPINIPVNFGPWTAQYYSNPTLSGDPVAIVSEPNPSRSWGAGSPLANVPVDNWSARWTTIQTIPQGNYLVQLRVDDGATVTINGVTVINAFTTATGQTYTANIFLPGGSTSIVITYFELGGDAFLDYQLIPVGQTTLAPTPAPTQIASPTGVLASVTAARLNVRDNPSTRGARLTQVSRGQQFPALQRSTDGGWVQINVNGIVGWVSSGFVTLSGTGTLPTQGQTAGQGGGSTTAPAGATVRATPFTVSIRSGPGTNFPRIARMTAETTGQVIGRNAANQWWQISYNGITGWVSAEFAILQAGVDVNSIPVTG